MKNSNGQSIIEALFLVVSLALVLTGSVALLVNSLNARTKGFDRKKATELADMEMETLVSQEKNNSATFYPPGDIPATSGTSLGYPGYQYAVKFNDVSATYSCATSSCYEAQVLVTWTSNIGNSVAFTRLFSKQ